MLKLRIVCWYTCATFDSNKGPELTSLVGSLNNANFLPPFSANFSKHKFQITFHGISSWEILQSTAPRTSKDVDILYEAETCSVNRLHNIYMCVYKTYAKIRNLSDRYE